jgi:predicted lipoprotein with Yx(FWY)xxD motif
VTAVLGAGAVAATLAPAPAAWAHAARGKPAVVVQVVNRAPFGPMLANTQGLSLYTVSGPCTGGCLTIWPQLLMPRGKTIPMGATGLGTKKVTVGGRRALQVTYKGLPLYTFNGDSGNSVNGNGVGGFKVATVS